MKLASRFLVFAVVSVFGYSVIPAQAGIFDGPPIRLPVDVSRPVKEVFRPIVQPGLPQVPTTPSGWTGPLPNPKTWESTSSNREAVQRDVARGWQSQTAIIAWGTWINHDRYKEFAAAAAAGGGPALAYLQAMAVQMRLDLQRSMAGEFRRVQDQLTDDVLTQGLLDSIRTNQMRVLNLRGIEVQIGVAEYQHWKMISGHYPKINNGRLTWEYIERRIDGGYLPPTYQPFIRARLVQHAGGNAHQPHQHAVANNPRFIVGIGQIRVRNDYGGAVTIILYHADALDREFGNWTFQPNEQSFLASNNERFAIGGNWQIEILFGNGVRSKRHFVSSVGSLDGQWDVTASRIFNEGR